MVASNENENNYYSNIIDSHLFFLTSCVGRRSQVRRRASSAARPRVVGRWWMVARAPARATAGYRGVDAPALGGCLNARVHQHVRNAVVCGRHGNRCPVASNGVGVVVNHRALCQRPAVTDDLGVWTAQSTLDTPDPHAAACSKASGLRPPR